MPGWGGSGDTAPPSPAAAASTRRLLPPLPLPPLAAEDDATAASPRRVDVLGDVERTTSLTTLFPPPSLTPLLKVLTLCIDDDDDDDDEARVGWDLAPALKRSGLARHRRGWRTAAAVDVEVNAVVMIASDGMITFPLGSLRWRGVRGVMGGGGWCVSGYRTLLPLARSDALLSSKVQICKINSPGV